MSEEIKIKIKCKSKTINELREQGLFFEELSSFLDINREDIKEVE